jgi:hypothetical protein
MDNSVHDYFLWTDDLDELTSQLVNKLKHENLTALEVTDIMDETFLARKAWVQKSRPRLRTILAKFPHLGEILRPEVTFWHNIIV